MGDITMVTGTVILPTGGRAHASRDHCSKDTRSFPHSLTGKLLPFSIFFMALTPLVDRGLAEDSFHKLVSTLSPYRCEGV